MSDTQHNEHEVAQPVLPKREKPKWRSGPAFVNSAKEKEPKRYNYKEKVHSIDGNGVKSGSLTVSEVDQVTVRRYRLECANGQPFQGNDWVEGEFLQKQEPDESVDDERRRTEEAKNRNEDALRAREQEQRKKEPQKGDQKVTKGVLDRFVKKKKK